MTSDERVGEGEGGHGGCAIPENRFSKNRDFSNREKSRPSKSILGRESTQESIFENRSQDQTRSLAPARDFPVFYFSPLLPPKSKRHAPFEDDKSRSRPFFLSFFRVFLSSRNLVFFREFGDLLEMRTRPDSIGARISIYGGGGLFVIFRANQNAKCDRRELFRVNACIILFCK